MLQSKSRLIFVIVSLFAVLPAEAVCFKRTLAPKTSDAFEFTTTLIDSLAYAKEALAATEAAANDKTDVLSQLVESIYQLRTAEEKYSCAVEVITPYEKSSVEAISLAARGTAVVFRNLAVFQRQRTSMIQEIANNPSDVQLGELARRIADLEVKADQTWRSLPVVSVAAATHALVRATGNPDGRVSTLIITGNQRKELMEQIVSVLGESVKEKKGGHALIVSASLLYGFVSDTNWKSSDAQPN